MIGRQLALMEKIGNHLNNGIGYRWGFEDPEYLPEEKCNTKILICGKTEGSIDFYSTNCGKIEGGTIESYSINCGKTPGVTIDSYNYLNGNAAPSSNGTAGQGSTAGGGGYYGGNTHYAGTSYANSSFSGVRTTVGQKAGNGYVKITLVESYPEVSLSKSTANPTNQNITITATAKDDVVGLKTAPYSWQGGARTGTNTYTATKNGTYNVNVINNHDYSDTASITITNIDKIDPVVNSIDQTISSNKKQTILTVHATDTGNADYAASGVAGYAITTTDTAPAANAFQSANTFTVNKNGVYYAWAKDNAGNISKLNEGGESGGSSIRVKDLEIDIEGNITWNDQENQYSSTFFK